VIEVGVGTGVDVAVSVGESVAVSDGRIGSGVVVGKSIAVAVQMMAVCVGSGCDFPMNCGKIEITAAAIVPITPKSVSCTLLSVYH